MKPLRLYQLPLSHYCEKVRWALAYKQLPSTCINVDVLAGGRELRHVSTTVRKLYPVLEDPNSGVVLSDSTPVLRYLDSEYPERPLFPSVLAEEVQAACLELDSLLGPAARRLAYSVLMKDVPDAVARMLVFPARPQLDRPVLRSMVALALNLSLMQRFRLEYSLDEGAVSQAKAQLVKWAQPVEKTGFVVGTCFTAADITLCSLMRPLMCVPLFAEDPSLQPLFAWYRALRKAHRMQQPLAYETLQQQFIQSRRYRGLAPVRALGNAIARVTVPLGDSVEQAVLGTLPTGASVNTLYAKHSDNTADNDQHRTRVLAPRRWRASDMFALPYKYGVKMRYNHSLLTRSRL